MLLTWPTRASHIFHGNFIFRCEFQLDRRSNHNFTSHLCWPNVSNKLTLRCPTEQPINLFTLLPLSYLKLQPKPNYNPQLRRRISRTQMRVQVARTPTNSLTLTLSHLLRFQRKHSTRLRLNEAN